MLTALAHLKERVFAADNCACFIERERALARLATEYRDYTAPDRAARIFSALLSSLSTPVDEYDVFVGRMEEALPDEGMNAPSFLLACDGHKSPEYPLILSVGFEGILARIRENAARLGDPLSLEYAAHAGIVIPAVLAWCDRWADAAEAAGKQAPARALREGMRTGAWDLPSALQCIWMIHMIASCCVGSRDYAMGYFDQILLPYYEASLQAGMTRGEAVQMLACFFVKTDEICGRTSPEYAQKPVLCHSSKQYINLGGDAPNDFSLVCLDAAQLLCMAQPTFTVMLSKSAPAAFADKVYQTMEVISEKMQVYNYDIIRDSLVARGVPPEVARGVNFSACCTMDLNHHTTARNEYYVPAMQIFCQVLYGGCYDSVEALMDAWREALRRDLQRQADDFTRVDVDWQRSCFVFDSYLFSDCIERCRMPKSAELPVHFINYFFPGVATIGDSLAALDAMVFTSGRYTYEAFLDILRRNFEGEGALLSELRHLPKFGNDLDVDRYAALAGRTFADAVDAVSLPQGWYAAGGFYSLMRERLQAPDIPATPDGRLAGDPYSENQSPTYGADTCGVTALLKSVAKLPFDRMISGGLNLNFAKKVPASILQSLLTAYFEMGGLHAGVSILDRATLEDALVHPEQHRSLTVRMYGFSEYFISLPEWQQTGVLARTVN